MKRTTEKTRLLCPRCKTVTFIYRLSSRRKKEGHYKNIYCYKCKSTHNHIELRHDICTYTKEEIDDLIEKMKSDNKYDM